MYSSQLPLTNSELTTRISMVLLFVKAVMKAVTCFRTTIRKSKKRKDYIGHPGIQTMLKAL